MFLILMVRTENGLVNPVVITTVHNRGLDENPLYQNVTFLLRSSSQSMICRDY